MPSHVSDIPSFTKDKRKKLFNWCLVALLLVTAAFFLGSWVENRIDKALRQHDALVAAAVQQAAPDVLSPVLSALQANDPALQAQGEALLAEQGYVSPEQHTGVRTIFTVFMLVVMLLRGAKLVFGTRRMFRRARGASQKASQQLSSVLRPAEQEPEQIPLRQALSELSELISQPLQSARTLNEIVLEKGVDAQKYTEFCTKLKTQLNQFEILLLQLSRLTSLKAELDETLNIQRYPLPAVVQSAQDLAAPMLAIRNMKCECAEIPTVLLETDEEYLPQALSHLMLSCLSGRENGSTVHLSFTPHGSTMLIDVFCRGQRTHIKNLLVRLATKNIQADSLDLAFADIILQSLGGTLEELSSGGTVAYRVSLPLLCD